MVIFLSRRLGYFLSDNLDNKLILVLGLERD